VAAGLFYSYSHRDEELRAELEKHLSLLRRSGHISEWHDRRLEPGTEWKGEIDEHLRRAQIILLLISADFLASDYCYDIEMKVALERHDRGEAVVIPVILRPVDWMSAPFARLQGLPKDARPITTWANRDEAFADVARVIREVVTRKFSGAPAPVPVVAPPPVDREQERVLDAALPKQVTVGDPAELLAMIRRSASGGLRAILNIEEEPGVAPEDVRSRPFHLEFPLDMTGALAPVTISLRIESPQFEPKSQTKDLRVPPSGDSEVCRFLMVPQTAGQLTVMLEAVALGVSQTSRVLQTSAAAQRAAQTAGMFVVSMPLFTASTVLRPMPPPAAAAPAPAPRPSAQPLGHAAPPQTTAPTSAAPKPSASSWVARVSGVAALLVGVFLLVQNPFNRTGNPLPPIAVGPSEVAEIQVTVVDPEGKPVAGAVVKHGEASSVTDEEGHAALQARLPASAAAPIQVAVTPPGGEEHKLTVQRREKNRLVVER
jgi:hypothetical protein